MYNNESYFYGTGRRKSSVARVRVFANGTGTITINDRDIDDYFGLETHTLPSPKGAWGLGVYVFNGKSISGRGLAQGCFGWSGAFGTHFYIDPVNDVTMTLMVNRMDIGGSGSYVSFGMEEAVFEELKLKEA